MLSQQLQWQVLGNRGTYFHIGMYHGADSGHLVVYCNSKVLLIDFGVNDTRQYPFFLDEELYELHIIRQDGAFSYQLVHNDEIDSPRNRMVRDNKKAERQGIKAGLIALAVLVFLGFFLFRRQSQSDERLLVQLRAGEGATTQVSLFREREVWHATYRAADQVVRQPLRDTLHDLRFPLQEGDLFEARYWPGRSHIVFIRWDAPAMPVLERYAAMAAAEHALRHPELSPEQVICQIQVAYQVEGAQGIAKMYHQNRSDGGTYNPDAYLRMVRDTAFRRRAADCL